MDPSDPTPASAVSHQKEKDRVEKLQAVLNICRKMNLARDVATLQELITKEARGLMQADRVSVFLLDRENCELWSIVSQEKGTIRFDARLGIAGNVALTGQTINVADAYEHPLFYKEIDSTTGFRTQTLLAVPLKNLKGEIVGVCEAVNKRDGPFTAEDAEILETFAGHVSDAFETAQLVEQIERKKLHPPKEGVPRADLEGGFSTQNIVGMSHRTQAIVRLIDQIRASSVDVLIQGESGTGKELVAKALHYNSPRAKGPFVALNCAAVPDNLVESELFGIEKGIATGVDRRTGKFEQAHGGTLFLDEVGDLSLAAQAKILRVLQERAVDRVGGKTPVPIDVRVIAATNKDLEAAIKERAFRADLYYRLKVIHIQTPSLRDVPEDIPLLANHFLGKYCTMLQTDLKQLTPAALDCLKSHQWPGNARQLENEVKRVVASVRGKSIAAEHLDTSIRTLRPDSAPAHESASFRSLPTAVEALERRLIEEALRESKGNKQKAALALGLSRQGLIKKLKRLRIGL
ncbi:MAG: sigma-54-dependent Fis family transcriptional regulator [Candidatus Binatia bacterium]